jgi:peptidoglycan/xylan/chitin deacetylase (PgdA/CDA1 family)
MEMRLNLKIFTYIISVLCGASFLAMIILTAVFTNAFDLQQDRIGDLRKINIRLVEENNYLQEKVERMETMLVAGDPAGADRVSEDISNEGPSSSASAGADLSKIQAQAAYVNQEIAGDVPAKTAYLTFNGGPSASTGKILDILKEHKVKATFFVIGTTSAFGKEMYRRIVHEGHTIGNLTYSHDFFKVYVSEESFIEDFNNLQELVYQETGVAPQVYRLPGGAEGAKRMLGGQFFKSLSSRMMSNGYTVSDWNIDSQDAGKYQVTKGEVVKAVFSQAEGKNEAVILFNDSSVKTASVEALPEIIQGLSERGFTFKAITTETGKGDL